MIMLGIDAHKRSHTVVAVDELGRQVGVRTTTATTRAEHLELDAMGRPVRPRPVLGGEGLPAPLTTP